MNTSLLTLAAGVGFSFLLSSLPAIARPTTSSDFSGKKICWDNGENLTYRPDGKLAGTSVGTWASTGKGVEIHTVAWSNIFDIQIQADGTYLSQATFGGQTLRWTGHVCK
jgi:hypothetical protein